MATSIDLFLSHHNTDKPWTERLAAAIEGDRSGPPLKVFFDTWDIPHGGDIPAELEQGLQNSRYVGLVLSPESLSSDWVTLERSTATHRDPGARLGQDRQPEQRGEQQHGGEPGGGQDHPPGPATKGTDPSHSATGEAGMGTFVLWYGY